MASGVDRNTGKRLEGWAYTVQCLNVTAETQIGECLMREYFGSLNAGLLLKENFVGKSLERWVYALIVTWELWVPMFDVKTWQFFEVDNPREGAFGIEFEGTHIPDAHLNNYATESSRKVRAIFAANAVQVFGI